MSEPDDMTTNPIFVVGASHSGTSLMNRLVGAHPGIFWRSRESNAFRLHGRYMEKRLSQHLQGYGDNGEWRFVEKTPLHFHRLAVIRHRFPNAQVLYMFRHPFDVCASMKRRLGRIDAGLRRWRNAAKVYFNRHADDDWVKPVRYEDLVIKPEDTLSVIFRFLGETETDIETILQFHSQPLTDYEIPEEEPLNPAAEHLSRRAWQLSQPLFDGRNRYRHVLTPPERVRIVKRTRDYAQALGYGNIEIE